MRRKFFLPSFVAAMFIVGCDCGEKSPEVPAPDGEEDNKLTTYCDALLPDDDYGREQMVWLLELIEGQDGEIDDALFVEKLHTTFFDCADRYMVSGTPAQWRWAYHYDGQEMFGAIYFDADGTYVLRERFGFATGDEVAESMLRDGYGGWYARENWHYEAESNTLVTSLEGFELRAEVLYLDDEQAVMRGHIGGISFVAYDSDGAYIAFDNELFLIFFGDDGRDTFLDGFSLTEEEFMTLYEEYANRQ